MSAEDDRVRAAIWLMLERLADSGEDATRIIQAAYDNGMTKFPPGMYVITDEIRVSG